MIEASQQPATSAPLYRAARRASWLGLAVNLTLGIVKLVSGIVGQSFALVSDAVNSLGDSLSSVVVLIGLWFSERPADEEHPYGHTRAEAIAASSVATIVIGSAILVGWEAGHRFFAPHPIPPAWTLWIAAANVFVKELLYRYKMKVGRRTRSMSLIANAWDHRSDAACSLAVLIGLGIVRWAGPRYIWVDEVAALVVVVAILGSGLRLFLDSASELMDVQADDHLVSDVRHTAANVPGVRAVEKLWVRKTGLEYLVDIHIQVDADLTVRDGHRISHLVKDRLLAEFAEVRDALVHIEPFPHIPGAG